MTSSSEVDAGLAEMLPRLRRFAFALARDAADADDLVGQAVERALNSRAQWQAGTRLDSWVYRITRNLWIDEARARARRAKVEMPPEAGERVGGCHGGTLLRGQKRGLPLARRAALCHHNPTSATGRTALACLKNRRLLTCPSAR